MLPVASLLILVPLIFAAVTFFTKTKEQAAGLGFLGSLVTLGLTVYAYLNFDSSTAAMQFFESTKWIPSLGANYTVGIDGISMPLILLNAIVIPLLILYSWKEDREAPNRFYGLILTMQAAVIGVFVALDFLVFYIFWELTLVPLFFMVNIWGGEKRAHASYKFFIYTHVASLVMLLGIFGLFYASWQQTGVPTFDMKTACRTVPVHRIRPGKGRNFPFDYFRVPGKAADLPLPFLAAGCLYRSPYSRQCTLHPAQNRRVRAFQDLTSHAPEHWQP